MVKSGMGCGKKAEAEAAQILKQPEYTITIDLKAGKGVASVFTCDFSIDYVKINASYRSWWFPFINGYFSAELCSPRVYFLDVLQVRLLVNPCAALLSKKILISKWKP